MIHLSCRHTPLLSVSQPRYIWAIDLLSLTLIGSHRQMCPCHRYMFSMVGSVGCECMVSLVHKAWFDDEFFLQPLRIYKTVVKKSHLFWQRPQYCACLLLLSNAFAGVITHSTSVQGSIYQLSWYCHANCIYPIYTLLVAICMIFDARLNDA